MTIRTVDSLLLACAVTAGLVPGASAMFRRYGSEARAVASIRGGALIPDPPGTHRHCDPRPDDQNTCQEIHLSGLICRPYQADWCDSQNKNGTKVACPQQACDKSDAVLKKCMPSDSGSCTDIAIVCGQASYGECLITCTLGDIPPCSVAVPYRCSTTVCNPQTGGPVQCNDQTSCN